MRRVFICSRYNGDIEANVKRAQELCRKVALRYEAPFAPHLLYPQFLADEGRERKLGMLCGQMFIETCDTILVDTSQGVSEGMAEEIQLAKALGIRLEYAEPMGIDNELR